VWQVGQRYFLVGYGPQGKKQKKRSASDLNIWYCFFISRAVRGKKKNSIGKLEHKEGDHVQIGG